MPLISEFGGVSQRIWSCSGPRPGAGMSGTPTCVSFPGGLEFGSTRNKVTS